MLNKGLSQKEVKNLQINYGENSIPFKEESGKLSILFSQINNPLIYILIIVGFISLIFSEYFDAALIGFVVSINISLGFFQEYNAKNTLSALRKVLKPVAIVMRDGRRIEIESKNLVPGDIVILGSGDKIPADGQLIEGTNVLVNQALLTGESEAIVKNTTPQSNSLFMGTIVMSGSAVMKVTQIGIQTEMGKIGKGIEEIEELPTPLQIKLAQFAKKLATFVLIICILIFLFGMIRGENPIAMFKMAIILSIAAIPEGLPVSITMILALGMKRVLKKNGLVKSLLSVETLGSTSVICTDKTGTLTQGKMQVMKTSFKDKSKAFLALILDNEQRSNLEVALWDYVKKELKIDPQNIIDSNKRVYQEPFDNVKKYSMSINKIDNVSHAFLMGAPEIVASFCRLSNTEKKEITQKIEKWAKEGLRILAVAFKDNGNLKKKQDFSWLGLIGIIDPIRPEVKQAISVAQQAGIKIKIVTGDYRITAEKVAESLGFKLDSKNIMEGDELETITQEKLKDKIDHIVLFTRVTPQHKLKIVRVLQEKGEIVAMTGDGVNDAQALKQANIGIAVGEASDVAKEASDLILLDSNFKTIIDVIKEGRLVFANIKKTVGYVLSNSFAEIVMIFGATLLGFPPPLLVVQILWVHLICDGPVDLSLAFEPKENTLMLAKPQEIQNEKILSGVTMFLIFTVSLATGLISLFLFWYYAILKGNILFGRTLAFATIASVSLVYIFAYKNLKKPIIQTEKFFKNKFMFLAVSFGLLLVVMAIHLPFLNKILATMPLKPFDWALVFGSTLIITLMVEVAKLLPRFLPSFTKSHK